MQMGKCSIEGVCGEAASPGLPSRLQGCERRTVAGAIPVMELMSRDFFPFSEKQAVLLRDDPLVAKMLERVGPVSRAGEDPTHGIPFAGWIFQLLLEI